MPKNAKRVVKCPYCGKPAHLVDSVAVYKTVSYGLIWLCEPCKAWVGVHKNSPTYAPLGRLADAKLRALKCKAHAELDYWWKEREYSRSDVYNALSVCLHIPIVRCHIGQFDVSTCSRVMNVCIWWKKAGKIVTKKHGTEEKYYECAK